MYIDRRRKRRNIIIKKLNIRRSLRRNETEDRDIKKTIKPGLYEVQAPIDFSKNNISGVISFIRKIEIKCSRQKIRTLKVDLNRVSNIDAFGIALFISLLNRLSYRHIYSWGTYPDNHAAKQYIIDSGFLDIVRTNLQKPSNKKSGNQLFMIGKNCVDSHRISKAVKTAMKNLLLQESIYPPVYDDMLEISANSVEHANSDKKEKNWLVSISVDADRLHFILADTGIGILKNLKKKKLQELKDMLKNDDAEVLRGVFNKMYQSVTGEINRHKGLPIVYESFSEGFISNLIVITNKIMLDFESNESVKLSEGFNGVLYSWTVSLDNYNNWKKSL